MSEAPAVSVCIVAYEARGFIGACLSSVFEHTRECPIEVLLIDNGSDGTGEWVAGEFPQVRVLPSEGNIGFGAGCNRLAAAARGELLLFLNPDTWLTDPAIDRLWAFARERPDAGAWGGWTVLPDGTPDFGNFIAIPTLRRLWGAVFGLTDRDLTIAARQAARAAPRRVDVLVGGFMLVPRARFLDLGGFDESYFLYFEEVDFFARFAVAGHAAWVTPDATIVHDVGSGQLVSAARRHWQFTGAMHFLRRHWPLPKAWLGGLALWLLALRRTLAGMVFGLFSASGRRMLTAHAELAAMPWRWWGGYRTRAR